MDRFCVSKLDDKTHTGGVVEDDSERKAPQPNTNYVSF